MRLCLAALVGALAAGSSWGAPGASLPSDVELASAYCIGVLQRQLAMMDGIVVKGGAESYATQQIRQHQQDLHDSLQSYLLPRMPYLDEMSLAGASARADADIDSVLDQGRRASGECHRTDADEELQCTLTKVQGTGPWRRMDRCGHIDFLPF